MPSVLTRAQANDAGVSDHVIARRVESGRWQRLLRGVYVTHSGPVSPDQRRTAALAYLGPGAILTGHSALGRHGLRAADERGRVHVLVPDARRGQPGSFVIVSRTNRPPDPPDYVEGMYLAPVSRAVVDACRRMRELNQVRALIAESVQCGLTSVGALAEELDRAPPTGTRLPRQVLAEVGSNAHSVPEIELSLVLRGAGLTEPEQNADVHDDAGRWLARGDFVWRAYRAIVEVDSVAFHLAPEDQWRTQERHNRLEAAGWAVLHYSPKRVYADAATVVAEISALLAARARLLNPALLINADQLPVIGSRSALIMGALATAGLNGPGRAGPGRDGTGRVWSGRFAGVDRPGPCEPANLTGQRASAKHERFRYVTVA